MDRPIAPDKFKELYIQLLRQHGVVISQLRSYLPIIRVTEYKRGKNRLVDYRLLLVLATVATVSLTGYALFDGLHRVLGTDPGLPWRIVEALSYTGVFLGLLLSHELGHLIASKKCFIPAEGPILIPAPPIQLGFLGTLGAVIMVKAPPASKRDLAKLGVSGPLFGFITATLVGLLGLYLSPVIPSHAIQEVIKRGEVVPMQFASLIFYLLTTAVPIEGVILIHPFLFASYVMYLVTFLNLLPLGQLDGGHVLRSIMSEHAYSKIGSIIPLILFATGITLQVLFNAGSIYIGLGLLSTIFYVFLGRRGHPGVANQYDDSSCAWCVILYFIMLILTMPVPIT